MRDRGRGPATTVREGYLNVGPYPAGKLIRTQLYDRLNRELKKPRGRQARQ